MNQKNIMIKNRMFILIGILLVFLVSFISAATDTQQVEDTFKLNEQVNYAKPCWNNGSYCSSAAVCNYTIFNPDKTVLVNETKAQNRGNSHNISFWVSNMGVYQVDMFCCDGADCGSNTMYFQVTGSGLNDNLWFYGIVLILSLGIMILGFSLKDAPITILGSFGMVFLGLYILFNGIAGIKDMVTTWAVGIILLGVSGYIGIRSSYELITDAE